MQKTAEDLNKHGVTKIQTVNIIPFILSHMMANSITSTTAEADGGWSAQWDATHHFDQFESINSAML